jgi:hypothetical protein
MTCPRCGGLVVHECLLDPREGLVWLVNASKMKEVAYGS